MAEINWIPIFARSVPPNQRSSCPSGSRAARSCAWRTCWNFAAPRNSARKVIRNLVGKEWLARVVGGRYILLAPEYSPENLGENNALALAAAAVDPSYIG